MDSLLKQTYSNIEIILIDDGSKDKSGDICDYYARKNSCIKVIHKKMQVLALLAMMDCRWREESIFHLLIQMM